MPGLLRGMARTAVVAGTATAVSNRVSRRQAERWGAQEGYAQEEYAAPPPSAQPGGDGKSRVEELKELASLKDQGVLTEEEFAAEKARILSS
jgi:Short C-terminal domain